MGKQQLNSQYIQDYHDGLSIWDIAEYNDDTYKNVYEAITGHRFESRLLPEEEKERICTLYKECGSTVFIGKMYGISHKPICAVLDEYHIKHSTAGLRKYKIDEHYFDEIDTQNKAYILGFLHADGNNSLDKGTIAIALQEEDREILEKMRSELHSVKPLVFLDKTNKHDFGYHYKNQYALIFHSKYMCRVLAEKGIVPNKSLVIGFPDWLEESYYPHYIRGVYDGDGSIYRNYRNDNNKPITLTITATNGFCVSLQKICMKELGIHAKIYDASCHNGITKVFTLSGRNIAKRFLDWMYTDAKLFLQRKYLRYCEYYDINNSLVA